MGKEWEGVCKLLLNAAKVFLFALGSHYIDVYTL